MDTPKSILTRIIKIIGIIAVVNSIIGVTFQKGMIMGMNFGNLSGNYDIREIFNSAAFSYFEFFNRLTIQSTFELMYEYLTIIVVFMLLGLAIPFFYRQRHNWDEKRENVKSYVKDIFNRVASSYIWSFLFGGFIGILVNFVTSLIYHLIPLMLALSLLPALLGYSLGVSKINSIMEKPTCQDSTVEMTNQSSIRNCTQLKINGTEILGNILLENSDAYFLHLNQTFLYIRKDGTVCASYKYPLPKDVKNSGEAGFNEDQIDSLCNTIEHNKKSA